MKVRIVQSFAATALLGLLFSSCGSDAPSQPTTVTPTPTPPPTTTTLGLGKPPVRVVAALFGYTRKEGSNQGRFNIPPMPSTFQVADAIDIGCTPRDEDNRETRNHPDFVEWNSSSGGEGVLIEKYDYVWNEGDRWADQVEIRYLSRTGFIDVTCRIPGTSIVSNMIRIQVYGGIR